MAAQLIDLLPLQAPELPPGTNRSLDQAADTIGAGALLVHAKDDSAEAFYEHFTFEASPSDPYHLLLIMKDSLQIISA